MKKLLFIFLLSIINITTFAQIHRSTTKSTANKFSGDTSQVNNTAAQKNNKEIFRELDLSKEQRIKLKDIREAAKDKRQEVFDKNDLTENEKKQQIKNINKETNMLIMDILDDQQWQKYQELKKNKQAKTPKNTMQATGGEDQ